MVFNIFKKLAKSQFFYWHNLYTYKAKTFKKMKKILFCCKINVDEKVIK